MEVDPIIASKPRPPQLSDAEFQTLARLAEEQTGIALDEQKRPMLYARLTRRLYELGLHSFDAYIHRLRTADDSEAVVFANLVTTNLTYFFREPGHFRFLTETLLQEICPQPSTERPLRIWSAGCSTGQEPYSIAMTIAGAMSDAHARTRILCTDVNTTVLSKAESGRYSSAELRGLPHNLRTRWFQEESEGEFAAHPHLRQMLLFRHLNLFDRWPIRGNIDAIFCRNVLIYFDRPAQIELLGRFAEQLAPGGHLFLGHSETLVAPDLPLERAGTTVYRRVTP